MSRVSARAKASATLARNHFRYAVCSVSAKHGNSNLADVQPVKRVLGNAQLCGGDSCRFRDSVHRIDSWRQFPRAARSERTNHFAAAGAKRKSTQLEEAAEI
jgi:hypothetical protein